MPYAYGRGDNCYGRGDYYRGDYYRGDPGIFSSIGNIFGKVAKTVGSVLPGPIGFLAKTVGTALTTQRPQVPMIAPEVFPPGSAFGPPLPPGRVLISPGGPAGIPLRPALDGCNIKGLRLNKTTYVTRGGGTSKWPTQILVHPKGTECVKIRRMNVANPRALRRSLRRAAGFAKLARRYVRMSAGFKKKGRKRR